MLGSPAPGAVIDPPTAALRYMRFNEPATQRTPCPIGTPVPTTVLPCSTMLDALGLSPLVENTRVSPPSRERPAAVRRAPPVPALLLQPSPEASGGLEQGQGITLPSPGSHITAGATSPG